MDIARIVGICSKAMTIHESLLVMPYADLQSHSFEKIRPEWRSLVDELKAIICDWAHIPASVAVPLREIAAIVQRAAIGPRYCDVLKSLRDSDLQTHALTCWQAVTIQNSGLVFELPEAVTEQPPGGSLSRGDWYVFLRCWPGFTETAPFGDLNHLPDTEAMAALRGALAANLWKNRAAIVAKRRLAKEQHKAAIRQQSKTVTGPPRRGGPRPRRSPPKYPFSKYHRIIRLTTTVGWQTGHGSPMSLHDEEFLFSPRVWLIGTASEELAKAVVAELNALTPSNSIEAEQRRYLNPRFGYVAAKPLTTGERAAIRASIDRLVAGNDPNWNSVARPFIQVAFDIREAWDAAKEEREPPRPAVETGRSVKSKRSTSSGDARDKIVAAVLAHHRYSDDRGLVLEPLVSNNLARQLELSKSVVSDFFKSQFGSHSNYRTACKDAATLTHALTILSGELKPKVLFRHLGDADADLSGE